MIKIHLANESKQGIGGGWTFLNNLEESMRLLKANVKFTSGASMVTRESVQLAKKDGKKIILRVDNIPRNSRNRNCGTTRLYDMAQLADWVVFQSEWAKKKVMPLLDSYNTEISSRHNKYMYGVEKKNKFFCECTSSIILNGVNTHIFKPSGEKLKSTFKKRYLIVRFNRDNNKRLEEALDMYSEKWLLDTNIDLYIVGQYSRELVAGYFDFYMGERFTMHGVVENRSQLSALYRSCDVLLYPSYSDACPNTVLEARACGLEVWHKGHAGIPEVMTEKDITLERMGREYLTLFNKLLE